MTIEKQKGAVMNTDNTFGDLLKAARLNKGWTQEELAEKMMGIQSKQNISNWERGVCVPGIEVRNELQDILECNLHGERKKKMNIKPLIELTTLKETDEAIKGILEGLNYQTGRKEYFNDMLERFLWLMVGYYRYIDDSIRKREAKRIGWDYEAPEWDCVAADLEELLKPEVDPFDSFESQNVGKYSISRKIESLLFKIGGELFEDFDEDGYRNGYIQQVGRVGEKCGYELIELLPATETETDTTMELRYAILKLSDYLCEL